MKCSRCRKEISERDKFCPYCGRQLKEDNKKLYILLAVVFLLGMATSYFVSERLFNDAKKQDENVLGEVSGEPRMIINSFDSIEAFEKTYSNGKDKLVSYYNFKKGIEEKGDCKYTVQSCSISVFDNNDVFFKAVYVNTGKVFEKEITYSYSLSEQIVKTEYQFKKNNQKTFDDLLLDEDDLKAITRYNEGFDVKTLNKQLKEKETQFNDIKLKLGHYGLGEYTDHSSLVIHRNKDIYSNTYRFILDQSKS